MIADSHHRPKCSSLVSGYICDGHDAWRVIAERNLGTVDPERAGDLMDRHADRGRSKKPAYHIYIRLDPRDRLLTVPEWTRVMDKVLEAQGLMNHQAIGVLHAGLIDDSNGPASQRTRNPNMVTADDRKAGSYVNTQHLHIAVNLIDLDTYRRADLTHDYKKRSRALRELENEFGALMVGGRGIRQVEDPFWNADGTGRTKQQRREFRDAMKQRPTTAGERRAQTQVGFDRRDSLKIFAVWNADNPDTNRQKSLQEMYRDAMRRGVVLCRNEAGTGVIAVDVMNKIGKGDQARAEYRKTSFSRCDIRLTKTDLANVNRLPSVEGARKAFTDWQRKNAHVRAFPLAVNPGVDWRGVPLPGKGFHRNYFHHAIENVNQKVLVPERGVPHAVKAMSPIERDIERVRTPRVLDGFERERVRETGGVSKVEPTPSRGAPTISAPVPFFAEPQMMPGSTTAFRASLLTVPDVDRLDIEPMPSPPSADMVASEMFAHKYGICLFGLLPAGEQAAVNGEVSRRHRQAMLEWQGRREAAQEKIKNQVERRASVIARNKELQEAAAKHNAIRGGPTQTRVRVKSGIRDREGFQREIGPIDY